MKRKDLSALPPQIAEMRRLRKWRTGIPMPPPGKYRSGQTWTVEDDDQLRTFYRIYGIKYVSRLLGRTMYAVRTRARRLGVRFETETWTRSDDAFLRKHHKTMPRAGIAERLKRTVPAVITRLMRLGLTNPPSPEWSDREIAVVRKYAGRLPHAEIATKVNHGRKGVTALIGKIGLARKRSDIRLSKKDIDYIRKHAGKMTHAEIARALGYHAGTVAKYARSMGLRGRGSRRDPWTRQEDQKLRKLFRTIPRMDLAAALGKRTEVVRQRTLELGLRTRVAHVTPRVWSEKEDQYLREHVATMTRRAIAKRLKRTMTSVGGRIQTLNLSPRRRAPVVRWTSAEHAFLRKNVRTMSRSAMASSLGRTEIAVALRLRKLGLGEEKNYMLPPRPWTSVEDRTLKQLVAAGASIAEIAAKLARSGDAVQNRKKILKLAQRRRT